MPSLRTTWMSALIVMFTIACGATATIVPEASAVPTTTPAPPISATPAPVGSATLAPVQLAPTIETSTSPPATFVPQLQTPVQFESLESREVRLTAGEIQGLVDPGIRSALADLAQRADKELDRVRVIAAQNVTWPDASLGCPEPGFSYAQALTEGIQLLLLYETEKFDYRITGVYSRLCENAQPGQALESRPLLGIWSRLADMPTPRSEVAAATVGGKIYVMGGFGAGATAHEEYDPVTDTWRKRAPIPRGVDHPAAVGLNGHVFLIGGLDGRWGPVDNVLAYDPAEDRWTAKAPLPTARGALGAAVRGGHILAFGG